jgi:hypothetical protein
MFRPVNEIFKVKETKHSLFKNLLYTFKEEIMIGMVITFIFASLNLMVPQLIQSFMAVMNQ